MTEFQLRPYQADLLSQIDEGFHEGCESIMFQLATGGGKTPIAAEWAKLHGGRIIFICHTLSVIGQVPDEFSKWGMQALSVGTGFRSWKKAMSQMSSATTIAATAGTALNNVKKSRAIGRDFTGLIVDEAHHAPDPIGKAKQVTRLVQMARRAGLPVLGMTATPWRLSKRQGFTKTWDALIVGPSWNELKGTYLSDIRMIRHGSQFIHGSGATSGMDYKEGVTIARNARNPIFTKGAFDMLVQHAMLPNGTLRKTIMYSVGQKHALNLTKYARELDIPTGLLVSSKDVLDRAPIGIEINRHEVNRKFRSGEIRLVINVDMITEGYDLPDCQCVIILRPTMSLAKWLQMCGRGSRLSPGKEELLLIDLTDNHMRLGDPLMERTWSLERRMNDDGLLLGDPVLRFCTGENGGSCNLMIHAGHHDCPNCQRAQGRDCDVCGKFRMWKTFSTSEGYVKWHCDLCRHEDEIPGTLQVEMIYKGWTKKGDLYYGLHLSDRTRANVFKFQRGPFMLIDRAYNSQRFVDNSVAEEVEPKHTILVETKWNGRYQNILNARYFPTALVEDTKI